METIVTEKAIIHINRPVLTDEERARRMEAIRLAAIRLIQADRRSAAKKEQLHCT